jgi:hypothetical protein
VAIGKNSLMSIYNGSGNNIGIGLSSLANNVNGSNSISIGSNSLLNVATGGNNIAIGTSAGGNLNGGAAGNICIGTNAGPASAMAEYNKLYISNQVGDPLIGGDFSTGVVTIKDVLALTPRTTYPSTATAGMIIVLGTGTNQHIYCYLNTPSGFLWKQLD